MSFKFSISSLFIATLCLTFLLLDVQLYHLIQAESRFNATITVKAVMLDYVNSYLLQPLCDRLIDATDFPHHFPSITANYVSYFGLIVGFVAAKLVLSERLAIRRLAVIVFFFRQFIDDLDGDVAREQLGYDMKKQMTIRNTSGYFVDGACDGTAFIVFVFCCFIGSLRANRRKWEKSSSCCSSSSGSGTTSGGSPATYILLQPPSYAAACSSSGKLAGGLSTFTKPNYFRRRLAKNYLLVIIQMGVSALFWNFFLTKYHLLLDPDLERASTVRTPLQSEIFKSSLMALIMWLWRCLNPHAITNYFLVAVWLNRPSHYGRQASRYIFGIIIGTSLLCEVHYLDIKWRLESNY